MGSSHVCNSAVATKLLMSAEYSGSSRNLLLQPRSKSPGLSLLSFSSEEDDEVLFDSKHLSLCCPRPLTQHHHAIFCVSNHYYYSSANLFQVLRNHKLKDVFAKTLGDKCSSLKLSTNGKSFFLSFNRNMPLLVHYDVMLYIWTLKHMVHKRSTDLYICISIPGNLKVI